ncbi:MAG: DUF4147 domain-containing protein [Gammaproteobacteria bacterium]|nr:DUF4147 domain-containing protein [Gammaproteobacteria bacterium]
MRLEKRTKLLELAQAGLNAVNGRSRVRAALDAALKTEKIAVVAIGKAAYSMAAGAFDALGHRIGRALIVTKHGYATDLPDHAAAISHIAAGHPLPDENSIKAGYELLTFLRAAANEEIVFLISGGASSLVELPPDGVSLAELRRVNRWLLGSGLPIGQINAVRKQLSCIKGGRLVEFLENKPALTLLISDVPDDDVANIGSGPLYFEEHAALTADLPAWVTSIVERAGLADRPNERRGNGIQHRIIARNRDGIDAVVAAAKQKGIPVWSYYEPLEGDAEVAGRGCANFILQAESGLHVWGGETTVKLPDQPGRGGRNQTFALAAAEILKGREDALLLALGTDGSDGAGEDAGAIVDGGTIMRGELSGLDPKECLQRADAGTFLAASGDLIYTGPTGTNVMDLVIAYKQKA